MCISGSSQTNFFSHKTVSEGQTDDFYKLKLRESLQDKYAIVLVGHSGSGYQGDKDALCESIGNKIKEIMAFRGLRPDEVIIIAGGTDAGIGAAYQVADSMGLDSLGIVASQGEKFRDPLCKTLITMQNQSEDNWKTLLPESGQEMVVTALDVAKGERGGELFAFNGGPQAYTEALSAAKAGYPVTVIRDFKPVDTGREQPFNVEHNLLELQNAGVRFEGE